MEKLLTQFSAPHLLYRAGQDIEPSTKNQLTNTLSWTYILNDSLLENIALVKNPLSGLV